MKRIFLFLLLVQMSMVFSQDGVDNWTLTTGSIGKIEAMVFDPNDQNIMLAGGEIGGIFKTTDAGINWFFLGLEYMTIKSIAICKSNPQYIYVGKKAVGAYNGIYKSSDAGATWTLVNNGILEPAITTTALLVHPDNPLIVWCAVFDALFSGNAIKGLYKTMDGGVNWFPIVNGIGENKNFVSLTMSPTDPNTIYAGTSYLVFPNIGPSKIYKSTDGGNNWSNSSNGLPNDTIDINPVKTISISTANPNVLIAGLFLNTSNGGVYVSTDAGENWIKKFNGAPNQIGTLIRSSAIKPTTDDHFFIGLDRNGTHTNMGVWATTDGGNNWFSFNSGAMLDVYIIESLIFKTSGSYTLYAGSSSWVYTNGGIYEYTFSSVPVELISFSAIASGEEVKLNWSTATELNNHIFEIERKNVDRDFFTIGFVEGNGTTTDIHEYSFTDKNVEKGNYFYRLKQVDYNGEFEYSDEIELFVNGFFTFNLQQNYPNPFNPTTKIKYEIPNQAQNDNRLVTLKVYDVLGNEIATLVNEEKPVGSYEIEWNASSLASGIYYYQLKAGNFVETKKMILLK